MACRRAYRPTVDGREQLEARLVLSHAGIAHLAVPPFHGGAHHHHKVRHPVSKGHGKVVVVGTGTPTSNGPTSQSNPTTPVVVVPIQNPPVSTPPTSTPPTSTPPTSPPPTTAPSIAVPTVSGVESAIEQAIVGLVNQQRQLAGLAPLQVDSRLVKAAQIHSSDMAHLNLMEHDLPGAALPTLQGRAQYVGYNYSYMGENIAFNYADAASVMVGWMNSPGHRANILNANYTQIGVGVAYDSQNEPYYTQEFGQPG